MKTKVTKTILCFKTYVFQRGPKIFQQTYQKTEKNIRFWEFSVGDGT
jgi:hypothetical protein